MAVHKDVTFFACLLVLGLMFLLVSATIDHDHDHDHDRDHNHDHKPCSRQCGDFSYGICPHSEESPRNHICATCCAGYKGCHYYSADEKFICERESDPRKPSEHCPRECDHKIAYSKCSRSEGPTIIKSTGCISCCTGYKGCYYYSKKGKFVCEGKSDEPKGCSQECIEEVIT